MAIEETQFRSMATVPSTILPRNKPFRRRVSISLTHPMEKTLANGGGSNKIDASRRIPNPYKTNRKSCFDDTQSNDKSGTRYIIVLDSSLLLIWCRERRHYQLFFLFSLISMSLRRVWDLYIFVCYNLSASVHSKITAFEFKLFIDSIKSR